MLCPKGYMDEEKGEAKRSEQSQLRGVRWLCWFAGKVSWAWAWTWPWFRLAGWSCWNLEVR